MFRRDNSVEKKCIMMGKSTMSQEQVLGDLTHWEHPRGGSRGPRVALETGAIKGKVHLWPTQVLTSDSNFLGPRVAGN